MYVQSGTSVVLCLLLVVCSLSNSRECVAYIYNYRMFTVSCRMVSLVWLRVIPHLTDSNIPNSLVAGNTSPDRLTFPTIWLRVITHLTDSNIPNSLVAGNNSPDRLTFPTIWLRVIPHLTDSNIPNSLVAGNTSPDRL